MDCGFRRSGGHRGAGLPLNYPRQFRGSRFYRWASVDGDAGLQLNLQGCPEIVFSADAGIHMRQLKLDGAHQPRFDVIGRELDQLVDKPTLNVV